jgi:CRISPR-associated protein Csm3
MRFKELKLISSVEIRIKTNTPLRVGAGKSIEVEEPDLPVIKHKDGTPIIPGSTLKGVFRSTLSRFLGKVDELLDPIFGNMDYASPIIFTDLRASSKITIERNHIRINKALGGAAKGGLFQVEAVPDNIEFTGKVISYNLPISALAGVIYVNQVLMNNDVIRIGGFKSRGYGSAHFTINNITLSMPDINNIYEVELGNIIGDGKVACNYIVEEKDKSISLEEKYFNKDTFKQIKSSLKFNELKNDGFLVNLKTDINSYLKLGDQIVKMWREV